MKCHRAQSVNIDRQHEGCPRLMHSKYYTTRCETLVSERREKLKQRTVGEIHGRQMASVLRYCLVSCRRVLIALEKTADQSEVRVAAPRFICCVLICIYAASRRSPREESGSLGRGAEKRLQPAHQNQYLRCNRGRVTKAWIKTRSLSHLLEPTLSQIDVYLNTVIL